MHAVPDAGSVHRASASPRLVPVTGALLLLCLLAAAACSPAEEGAAPAEAASPRITAEHPVTSEAAVEAGLWGDGSGRPAMPMDGDGGESPTAWVPVLVAPDMAASLEFYTALLGFDLMASEPAAPPYRRLELARDGVRLVLLDPASFARRVPSFDGAAGSPAGGAEAAGGAGSRDDGSADDPAAQTTGPSGDEPTDEAADEPSDGPSDPGAADDSATASPPPSPAIEPPVLQLAVADLEAVARRLAEAGVDAVERGDGVRGRRVAVADPAGHRLVLTARSPAS